MAKVRFAPTNSKKGKPLRIGDCAIGDIIYIDETQAFALILEQNIEESKIAYLDDGETDYCSNLEFCRKFVGEINFDVNDFEEFL